MKPFELAELAEAVSVGPAWLRAIIELTESKWTLRYAELTVGQQPAAWTAQTWLYETLAFLSFTMPAAELIRALSAEEEETEDRHLQIGEYDVVVPHAESSGQVSQRPSFELHDRARSSQPSLEYLLSRQVVDNSVAGGGHVGFLVGPDCPTFTSVDAAYRGYFLGKYDEPAQEQLPTHLVAIRVLDDRAWLGPIHIRPAEITVHIGGTDPAGTTLEYFSPARRERFPVDGTGVMTIPLPDGLPAGNTWLWLTEGHTWRDYRALTPSWSTAEQLAAAGVEKELDSRDEQAAAEAIIYSGEGPQVEFKQQLPEPGQKKTDSSCKTIAAYANGNGGTLVYGIDRDEVTVVGLSADGDLNKERDRIGQLIRTRVLPTPDFHIHPQTVDGKQLLFLTVTAGTNPPYGVIPGPDHRDKPEYYVRRGASTYPAQPSDFHTILPRQSINPPQTRLPRWPR